MGCATFKGIFLLEEHGTSSKTISYNFVFFVRSPRKVWFSSSELYASSLNSSLFQSIFLEKVVRVSTKEYFVGLAKGFFDYFLNNGALDYLVILSLFHRPFAFFCALGKIFFGRPIDTLYCKVSEALATLAGLISCRNTKSFIINYFDV